MTATADFGQRQRARKAARVPHPPAPRRWAPRAALGAAAAGLVLVLFSTITAETVSELKVPGGPATFVGSLTGMVGTYLALLMVLLISRIPFVERVLGQDGLLRWHRRLAPWPITLLALHAVTITLGYAQAAHSGLLHEAATLLSGYADVLAATVGLGVMLLVGMVSIRAVRSRLRRETWWVIHLYLYLALALSFAHALALGPSFVGHPFTRIVWSLAWAATAGTVLTYRFGLPIVRSLRHRLKVVEVRPEAPGVVSIICSGRHLNRLAVAGGQFFFWRFLTPGLWWQAHPYSISAVPRPPFVRLTVKDVGDHSGALARLAPGTRVAIEGPYGAFTADARRRRRSVLIAAGIGVTALRSLLEDLPNRAKPVVILRASQPAELALREELTELCQRRDGTLHELIGPRSVHILDAASLQKLVPDVAGRDAYVCGPAEFVADIVGVLRSLGLADEAIHHEAYAL
ncbi:MAG: ferredoxin reductase family protein [Acidimicrobiales bacterium]